VKEYFIRKGLEKGRYKAGPKVKGHACRTCERKHMSSPDTCNDGWPTGDPGWKDRGGTCVNYKAHPTLSVIGVDPGPGRRI
jgi:hypothetical protein